MERIKKFLFINSGTKQTIVKNMIWLSTSVTIGRIIRSLVVIYAARILGAEHYGIFSYALSLVAIFSIFSDIGLNGILTRELVKREEKKEFLATSFVIKLSLLALTAFIIIFVAPLFTNIEEAKPLLMVIAFLIFFEGLKNFIVSIYHSENRMELGAWLEIVAEILITTFGLIVLFKIPSAMNLAISYTLASGLSLILVLWMARRYFAGLIKSFRKNMAAEILKMAWPFAFVGVFGVLMTNIDSVIIGIMLPISDLGLFSAAQKPIGLLAIIPSLLYSSFFPFFSKFSNDSDKDKFTNLVKKSLTISLGLALPIVIGGLIVAAPLIRVAYGTEYLGSTTTFQVLLMTVLFIFPNTILSGVLLAQNKQRIFVRSSATGAIINVLLDIVLIPIYGIVGSAVATLAVQAVMTWIFVREVRKDRKILISKDLIKIIFATIIMSATTLFMKINLWPLIYIVIIAGIIYFTLLYILKEELINDIKLGFRK